MSEKLSEVVVIYADGACKGNPGPGGWGAWIIMGGHSKELCGGELVTTNNRMELMAVIRALQALKRTSIRCKDSTKSTLHFVVM